MRGISSALRLTFAVFIALLPFTLLPVAHAANATYSFSSGSIKLNVGQSATVSLLVNTPDEAINAADGTVVIPESYVSASSINKSGSIFKNWPEEPGVSGASIRFAGGLPTPGYQGSGGKIFTFSIKGVSEGTGIITVSGGRILANNANSTNIYGGVSTATVTVTRSVSGATISSPTHPDQSKWYNTKDITLNWTKPSGATSYNYTFGKQGEAGTSETTSATTINQTASSDGIWVFSLVTTFSDGKTASSSFTIHVDTTPPVAFTATVSQASDTDPFPVLSFSTTDVPSGIDHYEILVDGVAVGTTAENIFKLPRQVPGTHEFTVRAVDKAGNVTESKGNFKITGFPGPTITSYPKFVSVLQPITLTGKALYGTTIHLFIDGKQVSEFIVKENLSDNQKRALDISKVADDQQVEWRYTVHGTFLPGKHKIYATQVKPDKSESERSNEVTVRVLASSIQLGGIIIPMFVLILLLLLILLVVLLFFLLLWKKDRSKDEDWKKRVKKAEQIIDTKLENLQRTVSKDIDSIRSKSSAEKRVEKEIEQSEEDVDIILDDVIDQKD